MINAPKLIPNAKEIALHSHSMKAGWAGLGCLLTPEALYVLAQYDTNPRIWWLMGIGLIIYGLVGRVIDQHIGDKKPDDSDTGTKLQSPVWIAVLAMASIYTLPPAPSVAQAHMGPVSQEAFLSVAVPLVARWEGKKNQAYLDRIASPPVWTVCHGETRGVKQGDSYSDAQCAAMLGRAILEFRRELHKAFTSVTKATRLTPKRDAAYTSLAYNAGVYAISRSTAVRRLNAGDIAGGCHAIGWWNKAGNRVVRGLVNRRAEDIAYCMKGLG